MYQLTISYDGVLISNHNYKDAVSAVSDFLKCVDCGYAKEYATYNLSEPNGKMHTKVFKRNGEVSVK